MVRNHTAPLLLAAILSATAITGCSLTPTQQPTDQAIDDGVVTAKVKMKLLEDPVTQAHQIDVETFKGTVQLRGFVETHQARTRALQLTKEVAGVKQVKDALEVRKSTD